MKKMKGKLKSLTVDRYLEPIRNQIKDLVTPNAKVIEFGCGNGSLLSMLSPKIKYGLGIDKSGVLINYAVKSKEINSLSNIHFEERELGINYKGSMDYNFSIASLFLHVLPTHHAVYVLNQMLKMAENVLICEFSTPKTIKQRLLLWGDQRFSGHFKHFKNYQQNGYMEGLLKQLTFLNLEVHDTFDPVIKLYKIT